MRLPRKKGRWILIGLGVVVLIFSLTGGEGLINLYRSHLASKRMASEMNQLHTAIDSLKIVIEKFQTDTVYIERFAREKLGMSKPGEKVYKIIEE